MNARGPLRVLTYHRVLDAAASRRCSPSVVSATPAAFRAQMREVAARYRVLSADDVVECLRRQRPLPGRSLLITFDDGCRDFAEVAWPIMRKLQLPATVFVPTAYPGHPERPFWWDRLHAVFAAAPRPFVDTPGGRLGLETADARRASLRLVQQLVKSIPHAEAMALVDEICAALGEQEPPRSEVLGWQELRTLAADGVTIGAHTRTHPALTRLSPDEARAEIRASAEDVAREIGARPRVFAYPFGAHDPRVVRLVREEGFELAVTCRDGQSQLPGDDPLQVRRTNITRRTSTILLRARLTAVGARLDRWRHRERHSRGLLTAVGGTAPRAKAEVAPPIKVAYVMSRFPKLSETFVLNEMLACEASGIPVELFPLLRERQATTHPEVDEWVRRAHFHPFVSLRILRAHARFVRESPRTYATLLAEVFGGTWGSANFFVGALGIFPKAVRFALEMREAGVTHVHAHFATHPALAAFIVHRLTGIPFSFTAHGSDLHVDRRMLDAKVAAARFAVTVSDYNREVIVRECGEQWRNKVHVVHCGVDPTVFAPGTSLAPRGDAFQIVCVASFEEVKGHRFLVEACRMLRDQGVALQCHLVGEGPLEADIARRVAAAGLEHEVLFHGGLPRPRVARLLSTADAAVLASHPTRNGKREGIPVALMEAMASGVPVVATAISGIPELVESGVAGLLVPSGNPEELATALGRLAADPDLRRRMGRAGRARVVEAFNLQRNTQQLVTLFSRGAGAPAPIALSAERAIAS